MRKSIRDRSTRARCATRSLLTAAAAGSLLVAAAQPAAAHGQAETTTITFKDVTELFPNTDPCTGRIETVEATQTGVFHITQHADGHFHMGGTVTGRFTTVPLDPSQPSYAGRFTIRFGQNDNTNMDMAQFTNTLRAEGSDGSIRAFHSVSHITAANIDFSTDPPEISDVKVAFDKHFC